MLRALPICCLVFVAGCDLLFGPPPVVEGRPAREGEGDEGEGEEGEGEEGEGEEGEGEPDVPPDLPPHPLGPNIQSFNITRTTLSDSDSADITVVVTDSDGAEDIIGPLLIEPVSGTVLGPLSSAGAGTYTATVSWSTWRGIDDIEFLRGTDARFVRVQFSDNDGHNVSHTERITVTCNGLPACDNSCGVVRCAAEGNSCLSTEGNPVSDDALCAACNTGCQACATGCACFDDAPRCSNGSDCLQTVSTSEGAVVAQTCSTNGGLRVRDDGFLVWTVNGSDVGVLLDFFFSSPVSLFSVGTELCAPFGGLESSTNTTLPSDLRTATQVFALEQDCTENNLTTTCEPLLGLRQNNTENQGSQITCVNPIGGGGSTEFGGPCSNGSCAGDMFCDGDNTCQETCAIDSDCGSCAFDNPGGCHCDTATALCAVGAPVEGGFGQRCIGGTFGDCNSFDLFCDSGTCRESCSFSSDCDVCQADTGGSCTCNGGTGLCQSSGGGGTFVHNTGLGGTFTNSFPVELTLDAAIRACNAHFNVSTCRETCSPGSGSVTRDATCACSEPFVWVYANSGTHFTTTPGNVTGGNCTGVVGQWD